MEVIGFFEAQSFWRAFGLARLLSVEEEGEFRRMTFAARRSALCACHVDSQGFALGGGPHSRMAAPLLSPPR
ncbi:MAG TPA: hypothetical protein DDX54_02680 [Rhodospirillaceae bacterium]|jgi:hypothetical protein|nr:hypothetical protein [Alphaproteobacteria bacterium]HBH26290.1 hypothetical protein [Rhodospirillaceae bacterium]